MNIRLELLKKILTYIKQSVTIKSSRRLDVRFVNTYAIIIYTDNTERVAFSISNVLVAMGWQLAFGKENEIMFCVSDKMEYKRFLAEFREIESEVIK